MSDVKENEPSRDTQSKYYLGDSNTISRTKLNSSDKRVSEVNEHNGTSNIVSINRVNLSPGQSPPALYRKGRSLFKIEADHTNSIKTDTFHSKVTFEDTNGTSNKMRSDSDDGATINQVEDYFSNNIDISINISNQNGTLDQVKSLNSDLSNINSTDVNTSVKLTIGNFKSNWILNKDKTSLITPPAKKSTSLGAHSNLKPSYFSSHNFKVFVKEAPADLSDRPPRGTFNNSNTSSESSNKGKLDEDLPSVRFNNSNISSESWKTKQLKNVKTGNTISLGEFYQKEYSPVLVSEIKKNEISPIKNLHEATAEVNVMLDAFTNNLEDIAMTDHQKRDKKSELAADDRDTWKILQERWRWIPELLFNTEFGQEVANIEDSTLLNYDSTKNFIKDELSSKQFSSDIIKLNKYWEHRLQPQVDHDEPTSDTDNTNERKNISNGLMGKELEDTAKVINSDIYPNASRIASTQVSDYGVEPNEANWTIKIGELESKCNFCISRIPLKYNVNDEDTVFKYFENRKQNDDATTWHRNMNLKLGNGNHFTFEDKTRDFNALPGKNLQNINYFEAQNSTKNLNTNGKQGFGKINNTANKLSLFKRILKRNNNFISNEITHSKKIQNIENSRDESSEFNKFIDMLQVKISPFTQNTFQGSRLDDPTIYDRKQSSTSSDAGNYRNHNRANKGKLEEDLPRGIFKKSSGKEAPGSVERTGNRTGIEAPGSADLMQGDDSALFAGGVKKDLAALSRNISAVLENLLKNYNNKIRPGYTAGE